MEQQEKLKNDKLSLKVRVPGMASVKVGYVYAGYLKVGPSCCITACIY